jgi:hypothetical protein
LEPIDLHLLLRKKIIILLKLGTINKIFIPYGVIFIIMNLIILLDNIYRFSDQKLPNPVQISVFSNMCESENVTFLIPSPNMSIDSFVTVTG